MSSSAQQAQPQARTTFFSKNQVMKVYFSHPIENGWYPRHYCSSILCPIEILGKRDRASSHSNGFILLLSFLWKGLKRVMARRFALLTMKSSILPCNTLERYTPAHALTCRSALTKGILTWPNCSLRVELIF
jgi:hypothetical protein